MEKVRTAVIGFGHLGKWHCQKAEAIENCDFRFIVEPHAENARLAQQTYPHVKVVADYSEIYDQIDAAIVVTPTSAHYAVVRDLLSMDKHVLCEKPLTASVEQAEDLSTYLSDGQLVQVGQSERFHQVWDELKDYIAKTDDQFIVTINRYAPFKGRATDVDVASDLMIHDLDLLNYLLPSPMVSVRAQGTKMRTDNWDHVTATVDFECGGMAFLTSGRNHIKEERSFSLIDSRGCLYVDLFKQEYYIADAKEKDSDKFVTKFSYPKRDHLLLEQEAFYQSILNQQESVVSFSDGAKAVALVDAVLRAVNSGVAIDLDE